MSHIRQVQIKRWLGALLIPGAALAQTFPSKPIRIIVPFAAGGAVDVVARAVGQRMSEQMGNPVIIEDKPGASANLGAEFVAKAQPAGLEPVKAQTT